MRLKIASILVEYSHAEIVARMSRLASLAPHAYDFRCYCETCKTQAHTLKLAILTEGEDHGS